MQRKWLRLRDRIHGADCSTRRCPKDCSGNGKCNDVDGTCTCNDGFSGPGCSVHDDAQCLNNCTDADHGSCNEISDGKSKCVCKQGWGGSDCSVDVRCPEGLTPLSHAAAMANVEVRNAYAAIGGLV